MIPCNPTENFQRYSYPLFSQFSALLWFFQCDFQCHILVLNNLKKPPGPIASDFLFKPNFDIRWKLKFLITPGEFYSWNWAAWEILMKRWLIKLCTLYAYVFLNGLIDITEIKKYHFLVMTCHLNFKQNLRNQIMYLYPLLYLLRRGSSNSELVRCSDWIPFF